MPNDTYQTRAFCPFYLRDDEMSIACEGMEEGLTTRIVFKSNAKRKAFQDARCCTQEYRDRCILARALEEKYKKEK